MNEVLLEDLHILPLDSSQAPVSLYIYIEYIWFMSRKGKNWNSILKICTL